MCPPAPSSQATQQQVEAAQQDYLTALTDLRNQLGQPESAATAEPLGEFVLPGYIPELQDEAMIQVALQTRPERQPESAINPLRCDSRSSQSTRGL